MHYTEKNWEWNIKILEKGNFRREREKIKRMCVYVCVKERKERERETEMGGVRGEQGSIFRRQSLE